MKLRRKRRILFCLVLLTVLVLSAASGVLLCSTFTDIRKREVKQILHFYSDNMMLQLHGNLNEADALAQMVLSADNRDVEWFEKAAAPLLEREEIRYVCLVNGDIITSALPKDEYGSQVGHDLRDFSYAYTLAKVVKEIVVEGPVIMQSDTGSQKIFLFLQPITDHNAYLGEVAVALDCEFVLQQFGLEYLSDQGYDYELWRVDPQNGNKEVIAVSRDGIDFSHAAKTDFYLPTQWNLSIQPTDGWISQTYRTGITLICSLMAILMMSLAYCVYRLFVQTRILAQYELRDRQTGLYNQMGFTSALDQWMSAGSSPVILFYFVFEGYDRVSQMIGLREEEVFLKSIQGRLTEFIKNPFIAGYLGSGHFAVAVREDMNESQQEDFAKGLSLELLLKVRLNGEKRFLDARYQYVRCRRDGRAEEEIAAVIHAYYMRQSKESPVRMLTDKCRMLIDGQTDVVFDEYTDMEMMELSKTFNQYRKKVEQMAYTDPMFNVGNRRKYLRDANMLISYDKKRQLSLFCVDICSFSQYNELFSAEIGDQILREVLNRLSRPFGTYLYRINGDVFLGISMSGENAEIIAARLQRLLSDPVSAGNASFALQVHIAVCEYPAYGDTPEVLLDRIQSALRFAKESNQKIMVYGHSLDKMIRTEADILRLLKSGIQQGSLEVWYQPIMLLETGTYAAAEALVRLPDGRGGYFSAFQVISLAERSGMVEQLGDYVLNKACRFMCAKGKELGLKRMSINLSVQQLLVDNSADHLLELVRLSGVDTDRITLEITESILIQSIVRASAALDRLRQTGIHIALDDFGVGYSSLNYLSNLPVDVIKIDRSLTQQILTNPKQYALLRSIVEMAEINSLSVVAEGVETEEEQKMISVSGVQYIQGYYYARPMKKEKLAQFLLSQKASADGEK